MDDRDKDLTHLFVRDLDEIPLPPRGEWRSPQGRETFVTKTSRYLLTAGAIVAVLAIALIVGFQLRDRSTTAANPSASPTRLATSVPIVVPPSPTANPNVTPTPSAASSPASGAIFNDDFGFLVTGGDGPPHAAIRKESQNEGIASIASQGAAVSPDGKQIAYWTLVVSGSELHILTFGNNAEQSLVTLGAGQRAGGVVWSSDGAALLYSTETGNIGVGGGGPNSATLNLYEFAAAGRHGTTIDTQTDTGWIYRPIAWDRSANLAAAGLTGNGGGLSFYVTIRINPDNTFDRQQVDTRSRTTFGMSMGSIHASSDAKFVLGVDVDSGDIKWWPLAEIAATKSQTGAGKRGALWRPGTHEIGFLSAEQLWLGDVDKAGALGLCCTAFSGAPATSTLRTFRADGSAVVLGVAPTAPFGQATYTLVRLGSDPKATSGDRVTFQDLDGLTASVRFR
jgi:hypothetical protein